MIALLDLGLFTLSPALWAHDRPACLVPIASMQVHNRFLRGYPVRVLWSDDFYLAFPWSQAACPVALRDACVAVEALLHFLRGKDRLLASDAPLVPSSVTEPTLDPDVMGDEHDYPAELRALWLSLLAVTIANPTLAEAGLSVPTWARDVLAQNRRLRITNGPALQATIDEVPLLVTEGDWRSFIERYHHPDLRGRSVAILGGSRPSFERAREHLATYGLGECRRLPPAYEEHRTAQITKQRLQTTELLVICTNRLKHTDTDQIDAIKHDLRCAVRHLDSDTEAQIVKTVVAYFRTLEEQAMSVPPASSGSA